MRTSLASYTLGANLENPTGTSASEQRLIGNGLANVITGGAGADTLKGGLGNDIYLVGAGDVVTELSGEGVDEVHTGLASYALTANVEILTGTSGGGLPDFSQAEGYKIHLSGIDANTTGGAPGDQAFAFIGSAAFSNVAGELRFEQSGGFTYVEGDTNERCHRRLLHPVVQPAHARGGGLRVVNSATYRGMHCIARPEWRAGESAICT